ncbi:MAG: ABC transporter substrate-binding protein [Actinomycetota bacterium]
MMTLRWCVSLVAVLAVAGACGDSEIDAEDVTLGTTTTVAATADEESDDDSAADDITADDITADGADQDASPDADAAGGDAVGDDPTSGDDDLLLETTPAIDPAPDYPRTVTHALGDTEIPAVPQRVVAATGQADFDALLSLGVVPHAAAAAFPLSRAADFGFAPWNTQYWGRVPGFLTIPVVNLEDLAALEPDLIVAQEGSVDQAYDQFSGIAPTIAHERVRDWREPLLLFGDALGREAEAQAAIVELEAELAAQAERVPDGGVTVAMLVPTGDGMVTVYTSELGVGPAQVLEEIGVRSVDVGDRLSLERLADLSGADWVIVFDFTLGPTDEFMANPLLLQLPAAREGRLLRLTPEQSFTWIYTTSRSIPIQVDGLLTEMGY